MFKTFEEIYENLIPIQKDLILFSSFFVGTLLTVFFLLIRWIKDRKAKHSLFKDRNIPYVEPHLVYGSLYQLRKPTNHENELQVMEQWIKNYGKIFGYYIGFTPYLVVTHLDGVKHILHTNSSNYINRPKLAIKANPVIDTLVGLRNQRWKEVRGILSPSFSVSKLKLMVKLINEKVSILTSLMEITINKSSPFECLSTFQGLTLDVISSCAFAMETNCIKDQNKDPLFAAVRDFLKKAVNKAVLLAQYFPIFAMFLTLINNYWMKSGRATQMIIGNLEKVIHFRRNNADLRKTDILQTILDSAKENGQPKKLKAEPLSDKEIIANSWVFLLGGYETTAAALTFTTYLLAKHPHVQEKVFEEIKNNIPKFQEGNDVSYEDVMNLTYLDQVVNESLRIYPPVSTFLQREAAEDDEIVGYKIPKETNIVIPVWHIHHNPEYWPDPFKFDPERFSSEAKASSSWRPLTFLPFGNGPRNCIGMRFGQVTMKIALARILAKYRLEMSEFTPKEIPLSVPTVTITPKVDIPIRIVRREL